MGPVEAALSPSPATPVTSDFVALSQDVSDRIMAIQQVVGVPPTGAFDDLTTQAVKNFQARKNLEPSGTVDSETYEALFPHIAADPPSTLLSLTGLLDVPTITGIQTALGVRADGAISENLTTALHKFLLRVVRADEGAARLVSNVNGATPWTLTHTLLQEYVGTADVSGVLQRPDDTVRALQERLNAGTAFTE